MWRRCCAGLVALALGACVATPLKPVSLLDAPAQRQLLQALPGFAMDGRVAVAAGTEGFNATLDWNQQLDVSTVKLSGPLGAGSLQLQWRPTALRVTSRGSVLENSDAIAAVERELGFVPPFAALRYWVLGVPAPGSPATDETLDADGLLQGLTQQQWQIKVDRRVAVRSASGTLQLPSRLTATREGLRLRLVVDRWRLQ
jgi:outer membrane lipoprotein LolB